MELNHDVVKDVYPLYMDDELSPSVRKAVEEHLKECSECRNSYDTGKGFFDHLKAIEDPIVPKSVDDKLLLKIKLNRLKWVTFILIGMIFSILVTDYKNDREKLFFAIGDYYSTQRHLPDMLEIVKNKDYNDLENVEQMVHQFFEDKIALEERLNFVEKRTLRDTEYFLSLNTSSFNKMLAVMQYRYDQDMWSETDEAAYQAIQESFNELNEVVTTEYNEMHDGYSSYLELLNVTELDLFYKNINELSDSYTRYHKLPEQLKPMDEAELKKSIVEVLETKAANIELRMESPINYAPYTYSFEVSGEKAFHGMINGVTGQVLRLNGISNRLSDDPLMSEAEAEKSAMKIIERIFGGTIQFELVPLGFNYNTSANDPRYKVYSYKIIPMLEGYRLYTPFESAPILLHLDARTANLDRFDLNHHVPSFDEFNPTDTSIKVPVEATNTKKESVIIYSAISGKFEFVDMDPSLEDFEKSKFYSTETGKEEWIYFTER